MCVTAFIICLLKELKFFYEDLHDILTFWANFIWLYKKVEEVLMRAYLRGEFGVNVGQFSDSSPTFTGRRHRSTRNGTTATRLVRSAVTGNMDKARWSGNASCSQVRSTHPGLRSIWWPAKNQKKFFSSVVYCSKTTQENLKNEANCQKFLKLLLKVSEIFQQNNFLT